MWDLVPPPGSRTLAPCIESVTSYPLDHQESPPGGISESRTLGIGDQLVAGKKLKGIPGFLASAKGWDGGITQGRLDLGVKLRDQGWAMMRVLCLWGIQVEAAPCVQNTQVWTRR